MTALSTIDDPFGGLRVAITGGTSGLGLALVRELLRRGARVAFVARTSERVAQVAQENPGSHGIVGDVAAKNDIYPIAIQIAGELGGLDVLINNASDLGPTPLAMLSDTECEDLERAFATNIIGPFRLTKALMGALAASAREGRGAVVLNISSDAAINPYPGWGAYGSSKAALHHLERRTRKRRRALSLARSGRHGYTDARRCNTRCRSRNAQATRTSRARTCGGDRNTDNAD
jgi:NAD(P)-dependent dehydrogenase (short-subunit alcohol dehydrogenase family)